MSSEYQRENYKENQVEDLVSEYVGLGKKFENPPQIKLSLISGIPDSQEIIGARDIAVTTAFQCYAPGVTVMKKRDDDKSQSVADSTLEAGHHTTRMHQHLTWRIVGATRSVTHDVFHSHPFYNSEQQSQRYVEAKEGSFLLPTDLTQDQKQLYLNSANFANQAYFGLLKQLHPEADRRIVEMYPKGGWKVDSTKERLESKGKKVAQEVARYVLPIGQLTTYYHTLNTIQLARLFKASQMGHVSDEGKFIIGKMIQEVAAYDPTILKEIPLPDSYEKHDTSGGVNKYKNEFDKRLGDFSSALISSPTDLRQVLLYSLRNTHGTGSDQISDDEVIRNLADPKYNRLLADVFETGMLDPATSSLRSVSLTFATKLSHTADSQRQRHRRTPGATPAINEIYDGRRDYMTPMIIRENPALRDVYDETMRTIFTNVEKAIDAGIPREYALLLLPNASTLRVVESGDLFDWLHRWKQRLCYLAQEEIFFISVEQVEQVGKVLPDLKNMLLAPCGVRQRAGVRPRCPEGDRWCGKPVYNWSLDKYKEERLV